MLLPIICRSSKYKYGDGKRLRWNNYDYEFLRMHVASGGPLRKYIEPIYVYQPLNTEPGQNTRPWIDQSQYTESSCRIWLKNPSPPFTDSVWEIQMVEYSMGPKRAIL